MKDSALLVMDFINDIVHPDGKIASKGYSAFVERHDTLGILKRTIRKARAFNMLIIFIKIAFSPDYEDQPKTSPLFGKANQLRALMDHGWGTEFVSSIEIRSTDTVIKKRRVSPFFGTNLAEILNKKKIKRVFLSGCSTDLVVESAARDAHDRDYKVFVIADCCAAACEEDHNNSLKNLAKISQVGFCDDLLRE